MTARPEVSDELFPFESRFADIDGAHVHYIDEGEGPSGVVPGVRHRQHLGLACGQ